MKKELSPPQTIAIVAVFIILIFGVGWWWINRNAAPPESALGGNMPSTVPGQQGGGDPNATPGNPGSGPQMTRPDV